MPRVVVMLPAATKLSRDMRRGVLRYAAVNGPWIIHLVEGRPGEHTASYLRPGACDGVIGRTFTPELERLVARLDVPKVLVDQETADRLPPVLEGQSMLRSDTRAIGRMAANFFAGRGYSNFAYVAPRERLAWGIRRGQAFAKTVAESGFRCEVFREKKSRTGKSDLVMMAEWLSALPKPVAVLAAFDQRALEVIDACALARINVPEDVSILGVDNDAELDDATFPTLSSIALDAESAAYRAAEELDRLMRGSARNRPCLVSYGPTRVVERDSTGKAHIGDALVSRAISYISSKAMDNPSVREVADALHVSQRLLEARFRNVLHRSAIQEIRRHQLDHVAKMLRETNLSIGEIAEKSGVLSESRLGVNFRKRFGVSMTAYRRGRRQ